MANEVRISNTGAYVESDGDSLLVSNLGVYVEVDRSALYVSNFGVYVESSPASLNVSSFGLYVESKLPSKLFAIVYNGYKFCSINSIKFQQKVSIANVELLTDIAGNKIPILPDWQIDVTGFWCRELALSIGNLGDSENKRLSAYLTDRFYNTFEFSNNLSFITNFNTDINIDNVLIYNVTFVGSGVLSFSEFV